MRIITIGFLTIILLWGCSAKNDVQVPESLKKLKNLAVFSTDAKPAYNITLKHEIAYGSTRDALIGRVGNIAVDDSGRLFIADLQQTAIHVYNADGSFLQDIGRKGRGPGDFQSIQDLKIHNAQIYVLDNLLSRISVIDLGSFQLKTVFDLSFESRKDGNPSWVNRTRKRGLNYRPNNIYVRPDGSYLVLFSDNGVGSANNVEGRTYETSIFSPDQDKYIAHDLLSFKWTGQVLIHKENQGMIVMFRVPYKRSSKFDFNNGTFVLGWTEDMLFKFYDQNGAYQRAFYYPHSNIPLHLKDVLTYYKQAGDQIKRAIENDDLPQTWPAFNTLKLDDKNRLWVSTIVADQGVYQWWVLDRQGKLLAQFTWPRNRSIKVVKNGYVYTLETDKDTGVEQVVRYRIEMGNP